MSGKRQATSNLNHDNWDQELEPEERGTFKTAPPDELKTRVIKKATRRKATAGASEADDADGPSTSNKVFSGFSAFGMPGASGSSAGAASSPFAFLAKLPSATVTSTVTTATATSTVTSTITSAEAAAKISASSTTSSKDDAKWTTPAKLFTFDSNLKNVSSSKAISGGSIFGGVTPPTATAAGAAGDATKPMKPPISMFKASLPADKSPGNCATAEFRDNVAALNMAIMKFLQEHMDKNPYVILSPVFESYDKYLKQLQLKDEAAEGTSTDAAGTPATSSAASFSFGKPSNPPTAASFSFGKPSTPTNAAGSTPPSISFGKKPNCTVTSGGTTTTLTTPLFSFPTKSDATPSATAATNSIFSFGLKMPPPPATESSPKPSFFSFAGAKEGAPTSSSPAAPSTNTPPKTNGFSFSLKPNDDKPSTSGLSGFGKASTDAKSSSALSGFSFSSAAAPFSFGGAKPSPATAAADSATASATAEEDDEDQPPKVEFKQVVEEDAIFSKRCKVFAKKDKDFNDRGVGTLYLKPVKDSKKTQMIVRADTNLGNILINLILVEGLPCQRMGKNNVMMVCVPTPEEKKSMTILLRVKTGEEADELLQKIKEHTV